jgi:hypothetical protein
MMKGKPVPVIKFHGTWAREHQAKVPKGFVVFEASGAFAKKLRENFLKLKETEDKIAEKNGRLIKKELVISAEYHYRKVTLDQLALMWSLYDLEANEINGGENYRQGAITKEQIYQQDLEDHALVIELTVPEDSLKRILSEYHHIIERNQVGKMWHIKAYESASMMNVKRMSEWIERIFNRIAENGVEVNTSKDILSYWSKWRQHLNDSKIVLHSELKMTKDQYKTLNPMCEACGTYLAHGGGSLAHIKARGMGRGSSPEKEVPGNWLHLCDPDHDLFDNGGGRVKFLKKYPHLKYKVEKAIRRPVERQGAVIEVTPAEVCEAMGTSMDEMADAQAMVEQEEREGDIPIF